ncbi:hypothetical protein ACFO25_02290 [Paenactinomyces guangxiensis]|uniref:DUF975 family protein n=1 Tax=Paenactinomyces guangxiensis TaxID=1490290 RepID=A0A7W2AA40_9BACL|nr:hypothetical protein [Paenactinomyces guangxiensis]MBA4496385.1 hypothetical protein [Paenactinomyces guangxiensis]MBH8593502.1 hypothetical protein [Paenactinomyces guangxiensis]
MNESSQFQPLGFGELLDGTLRIYRRHFWSLWTFCFLISFPFNLWIEWWYLQETHRFASIPADRELIILLIDTFIWFAILPPFIQSACVYLSRLKRTGWKELFVSIRNNLWKVLAAHWLICLLWGVLFTLIVVLIGLPLYMSAQENGSTNPDEIIWMAFSICMLVFLIPGSYFYVRLSLVTPVIVEENPTIWRAITRSWELTKGVFGSTLGILVCLGAITIPFLFVQIGIKELSTAVSFYQTSWIWDGIYILSVLLIDPLLLFLYPVFCGIFYWNQRARKEAYDLQYQLQQVSTDRR